MAPEIVSSGTRQRIKVVVAKDVMSASVLIRKPATDEPPLTVEEIVVELNRENVLEGIDKSAIARIIANDQFNTPVKVASGLMPEKGINASFTYHFDTSDKHKPKEASDGRIDYHDINFIQNTTTGTVLVTKTPPTVGCAGQDSRRQRSYGSARTRHFP